MPRDKITEASRGRKSGGTSRTTTTVRSRSDEEDRRLISFSIGDKVYEECIDGNIELSELTPDEMRNALNRAVGKYAYYGALRADAKRLQAKIESEYKAWQAIQTNVISSRPDFAKATGKAVEIQMMVENEAEVKLWEKRVRDTNMICDKLWVLITSFELMTKTIQSCMAMTRVEIESAGRGGFAHGAGDMVDE